MRQHALDNEYELIRDVDDGNVGIQNGEDEEQHGRPIEKVSTKAESTDYLNGLRGVAAVMVFQHHIFGWLGVMLTEHFHGFGEGGRYYFISLPGIRLLYCGGGAAVCTFFVLSGFVVVQSALRLQQSGRRRQVYHTLVSAAVRRPVRLYLPCWIIGFARVFIKHIPLFHQAFNQWGSATEPDVTQELRRYVFDTLAYFQPFRDHDFNSGTYTYGIVMWTIPIELKGSIMVYAMIGAIYALGLSPAVSICLLAITAAVMLVAGWWAMACFTGGLTLAVARCHELDVFEHLSNVKASGPRISKILVLIIALYLLSQPNLDGHPETSLNTFGWHFLSTLIPRTYTDTNFFRFWVSLGAVLLVWISFHLPWLQRFFRTRPLQYLGKVSFMLYLIHLPIAYMVVDPYILRTFGTVTLETNWWDNRLYIPDIGPRGLSTRWAVQWTILFSLTLGLADLATRFIDDPCTRLSRWVGDRALKPTQPNDPVDPDIALESQQPSRAPHSINDATLLPP